jgi:hypothetical protein
MLRSLAFIILLFLPAQLATAGSLGVNWSALKPGQYQVFRTSEGAQLISRYGGLQNGLYLFEVFYGRTQTGEPVERVFLDHEGQFVRSVFESGEAKQFEPHDCSRTLGACEFLLRLENGDAHQFSQITKRTSNGFSFVRRDDAGRIVMRGNVELNQFGLTQNLSMRTPYARGGFIEEIKFVQ